MNPHSTVDPGLHAPLKCLNYDSPSCPTRFQHVSRPYTRYSSRWGFAWQIGDLPVVGFDEASAGALQELKRLATRTEQLSQAFLVNSYRPLVSLLLGLGAARWEVPSVDHASVASTPG